MRVVSSGGVLGLQCGMLFMPLQGGVMHDSLSSQQGSFQGKEVDLSGFEHQPIVYRQNCMAHAADG